MVGEAADPPGINDMLPFLTGRDGGLAVRRVRQRNRGLLMDQPRQLHASFDFTTYRASGEARKTRLSIMRACAAVRALPRFSALAMAVRYIAAACA